MLRNTLYQPWFADEDKWGFTIIDGFYKDVVVQIQNLKITNNDNEVMLDFNVIKHPAIPELDLSNDPVFNSQVELIINDILNEALEILENEQYRDNNT